MAKQMKGDQPLVSVVVPVYNVECFLDECLCSILEQDYKDIEIILVNDGSSDKSGDICDKYAKKFEQIRVIHKENGGLSSARNTGISVATGEYITFIDSDDYYISRQAISILINVLQEYDVDVVCCNYTSDQKKKHSHSNRVEVYDREQAISILLDDHGIRCYAWNKLFKKEIFTSIRFPESKYFEDISTMYTIMCTIERIAYIKSTLYFYRKRFDSITAMIFSEKNYDLLDGINYIFNDAKDRHPEAFLRLRIGYAHYYLTFVNKAFFAESSINKEENRLRQYVKENIYGILSCPCAGLLRRILLLWFGYLPVTYKQIIIPLLKRVKGTN